MPALSVPFLQRVGAPALLAWILAACACGSPGEPRQTIEPVYDPSTGKLNLLKFDGDADGSIDTWSYMDGARVVRIEIDLDHDAKIDRWEYYGSDRSLTRVEASIKRDGKRDRVELYEAGVLTRAEEDTDGDGKVDKWTAYDHGRLASVAFDTMHRGSADRRLVYGSDGSTRLEIAPAGDGRFVVSDSTPAAPQP